MISWALYVGVCSGMLMKLMELMCKLLLFIYIVLAGFELNFTVWLIKSCMVWLCGVVEAS